MDIFNNRSRIIIKDYYFIISNSLFNDFKEPNQDGTSIYINLDRSLTFLSYSVICNNEYKDGSIFGGNGNTVSLKCIVQYGNSGVRGSNFLNAIGYVLLNTFVNCSSERAKNSYHGTMASGRHVCHFNFNNISDSQAEDYSVWHFGYAYTSGINKYCQMTKVISNYVLSWNKIGTLFELQYFVFENCSASKLNYQMNSGNIIYRNCTFFLKHYMGIGSSSQFLGCYSDGTLSGSFTYTEMINDAMFPETNPCSFFKSCCQLSKSRTPTLISLLSLLILNI